MNTTTEQPANTHFILDLEEGKVFLDQFREPIGLRKLGTVWPSKEALRAHEEELKKIVSEQGFSTQPRKICFHSTRSGKDFYLIPALKVWWIEDFA